MDSLYQEIILEHYRHPHNAGRFSTAKNVCSVNEGNVGCGDEFQVSILLDNAKKKVLDIKWQGVGCAISTAAMSVVSDFVKNKKVIEISALTKNNVLELLGMNEITLGRDKCLMLGLRAIQRAVKEVSSSQLRG